MNILESLPDDIFIYLLDGSGSFNRIVGALKKLVVLNKAVRKKCSNPYLQRLILRKAQRKGSRNTIEPVAKLMEFNATNILQLYPLKEMFDPIIMKHLFFRGAAYQAIGACEYILSLFDQSTLPAFLEAALFDCISKPGYAAEAQVLYLLGGRLSKYTLQLLPHNDRLRTYLSKPVPPDRQNKLKTMSDYPSLELLLSYYFGRTMTLIHFFECKMPSDVLQLDAILLSNRIREAHKNYLLSHITTMVTPDTYSTKLALQYSSNINFLHLVETMFPSNNTFSIHKELFRTVMYQVIEAKKKTLLTKLPTHIFLATGLPRLDPEYLEYALQKGSYLCARWFYDLHQRCPNSTVLLDIGLQFYDLPLSVVKLSLQCGALVPDAETMMETVVKNKDCEMITSFLKSPVYGKFLMQECIRLDPENALGVLDIIQKRLY